MDSLLVGSSPVMRELREQLLEVAPYDVPVSLRGESGTGKGAAALFLHRASARARGPFVTMSMTGLTPGLEVDRFVGHAAGAFTDAKGDLPGAVEAAYGGSLFLDEVGDAAAHTQGILLQVLEDQQVQRQGEHRPRTVDVRFILATNRDLERAVAEGTFRPDLYYRLPSIGLTLPPLRDHRDDLPELADVLLARACARFRCPMRALRVADLELLAAYSWPGNVRELDGALVRWLIQGRFPPEVSATLTLRRADIRTTRMREALAHHAGHKSAAARELGVSRTTLYRWLSEGHEGAKV